MTGRPSWAQLGAAAFDADVAAQEAREKAAADRLRLAQEQTLFPDLVPPVPAPAPYVPDTIIDGQFDIFGNTVRLGGHRDHDG